jgi:hypothetical protein
MNCSSFRHFNGWPGTGVPVSGPAIFLSDNAAAVHPKLWEAMRAADAPDNPYDGDAL